MFREMRRADKRLSTAEAEEMFVRASHGTLAVLGDDGYPYSVPVSHVYRDGKFYFHSAVTGHKIDAVTKEPKASISVVEQDVVVPEKFTTRYRSAIAFGKVRILEDAAEVQAAMEAVVEKFSPGLMKAGREYIEAARGRFLALEMTVEHMTAKGVERPKG